MTESAYKPSLLQPLLLLLPSAASSKYIIKVIEPLSDVLVVSTNRFAIYHPHYKDKFVDNPTRALCAVDNFYFLSNFDNFSAASPLFASNHRACAIWLGLVVKKKESLKTSSIYTTDTWIERAGKTKTPSLLLNLTLFKICPVISKWAAIFEWQFVWNGGAYATEPGLVTKKGEPLRTFIYLSYRFQPPALFFSLNFASFPLLAEYSSVKLNNEKAIKVIEDCKYLISIQNLPDAPFDLFRTAPIVEYWPDDSALLIMQL